MGDAAATVEENVREAQVPQRVRVVGHSTGGAVAALMAMILDGGAFPPATTGITFDVGGMESTGTLLGEAAAHSASGGTVDFKEMGTLVGSFANRVHCTALGPPPCLSRQTVPRYINTFVCGDDLLPRAQPAALRTLRNRVLAALEAGAGRKRSLGYLMGTGLLQDFTKIAGNRTVLQRLLLVAADCYLCLYLLCCIGKSVGRYRGEQSAAIFAYYSRRTLRARDCALTTGSKRSNNSDLSLPGRVFFIKPRKLKAGATIQRVLRGNWQEDMLWQLHDVLISQRMLEHHTLDSYIRTLNRC
jgi:hypothetical protein